MSLSEIVGTFFGPIPATPGAGSLDGRACPDHPGERITLIEREFPLRSGGKAKIPVPVCKGDGKPHGFKTPWIDQFARAASNIDVPTGLEIVVQPSTPTSGQRAEGAFDALKTNFEPRPPRARLSDLILPSATLSQIETALARVEHHEVLYKEWGLAALDPRGAGLAINFYGPPGTGKTLCAEAIASRLQATIIEVSYAEIESKYVGETPKNIVAAFRRARDTGSVLFFDEADSILGRRMTNVTQAADHGVNVSRAVMLKELDAFSGVVIFATNLARNFDDAFVRRILAHVEMRAPEAATRLRLWAKLLPARLPGRPELDIAQLCQASEELAGGDIKNVIVLSASRAVAREASQKRVTMPDVLEAIEQVRKAKREVGRGRHGLGGVAADVGETPA